MKFAAAFCAGVALAGLTAAYAAAPGTAAEAPRFAPPPGKLVLARSLIRELSDGKRIVVTRRYLISFEANGTGYRINGEPIGVDIEAPPVLGPLIDYERQRVETGLFPLQLLPSGLLDDQHTGPIDGATRDALITHATAALGPSTIPDPVERRETLAQIARLANRATTTPWPADLFHAAPGARRFDRAVTLADGRTGAVVIELRVDALLPCGVPQRFERVVTTRLPGSQTVSREVFTFAAP